jgi:hypothetical protein
MMMKRKVMKMKMTRKMRKPPLRIRWIRFPKNKQLKKKLFHKSIVPVLIQKVWIQKPIKLT